MIRCLFTSYITTQGSGNILSSQPEFSILPPTFLTQGLLPSSRRFRQAAKNPTQLISASGEVLEILLSIYLRLSPLVGENDCSNK